MNSHGKPRQPKETQGGKAGTLRYEQATETWHCAKCDKKYPKQNARSAKSHANEHTKAETKQRIEYEKNILQHYAQQNIDETRLRTLRSYGQEYRGKIQPAATEPTAAPTGEEEEKQKNDVTREESGAEKETKMPTNGQNNKNSTLEEDPKDI